MRRAFVLALMASLVIAGAAAGPLMSRVEQPAYKVERSEGAIEVRAYPSMTLATTIVSGVRAHAIDRGFRILANYIFGENDGAKKIAMTAPVMQERAASVSAEGDWSIRFVMPRAWSKDDLPPPRDHRITLTTVPAATFAVVKFSGLWRDASLRRETDVLEAFMARNKLTASAGPIYAFYNPPWTLPFFRRNEVMIEIDPR